MPDYASKITIDGDEILLKGVPSPVVSRGVDGLCPALPSGSGTSKYLREDGTWVVPPDTYMGTDGNITWSSANSYSYALRKLGNIGLIWARYQYGGGSSTTGVRIGTLPSGYRPTVNIRIPCIKTNSSDIPTGTGVVYINTAGEMSYFGDSMAYQEFIAFDGFMPI